MRASKRKKVDLKTGLVILGSILIIAGGVFALQGLRVLPSQLMYGKPEWIWIGGGLVVIGAFTIFLQSRKK